MHICHTLGLAILPVTASQIMKKPLKFMADPINKRNQVGVTSAIRPERTPIFAPRSLKNPKRFKVLWS
ncbi:hypothetical protein LguiA_012314 [Lonicera macranthoides]